MYGVMWMEHSAVSWTNHTEKNESEREREHTVYYKNVTLFMIENLYARSIKKEMRNG